MGTNTGRGRALRAAALAGALVLALAATGCSSQWEEAAQRLEETQTTLERRHAGIGAALAGGMITNAALIERYAQSIEREVPEAAEVARELAVEATTQGRAYRLLGKRIKGLDTKPQNESALNASNEEAQALHQATQIETFDAALGDIANVLADLSGGRLARVAGPSGETSSSVGPGELLVGNPSYGHWERQSDGTMTWLFAGYLAGLGSRFYYSPGGYHYDDWYDRRPWTYYSDHGRSAYGTARERTRWRSSVERWGEGGSTARRAERTRSAAARPHGTQRPAGGSAREGATGTSTRAGESTRRTTAGQGTGSVSGSRRSAESTYAGSGTSRPSSAGTAPKKKAAAASKSKRRVSTWGSSTRRSSGGSSRRRR